MCYPPTSATSVPISLPGGPGATNAAKAAEESYVGASNSGAATNANGANPAATIGNLPGLVNGALVLARDGFGLGSTPEVTAKVYYNETTFGIEPTGVSINNTSNETIAISGVNITNRASPQGPVISQNRVYPENYPTLQSSDYGTAAPGYSSNPVNIRSNPMTGMISINIMVGSASGRFGSLNIVLNFYPK
jgi:hypothetical protein